MFGLTNREWIIYGIGASIQGALLGALYHDMFILVLNMVCLGIDLYLLPRVGEPE